MGLFGDERPGSFHCIQHIGDNAANVFWDEG